MELASLKDGVLPYASIPHIPHKLLFFYMKDVPYRKFHVYRHTFGTMLCDNGVPIQVASSLLGHADISITAKYYVNIGLEQKQDAMELLQRAFNL